MFPVEPVVLHVNMTESLTRHHAFVMKHMEEIIALYARITACTSAIPIAFVWQATKSRLLPAYLADMVIIKTILLILLALHVPRVKQHLKTMLLLLRTVCAPKAGAAMPTTVVALNVKEARKKLETEIVVA